MIVKHCILLMHNVRIR